MKTIVVNGKEYQYKIFFDCSEYGEWSWTVFYDGTMETLTRRKYWLFGPVITKTQLKSLFTIYYSIEDPKILKADVRKTIESRIEQLGREAEIKRGEII